MIINKPAATRPDASDNSVTEATSMGGPGTWLSLILGTSEPDSPFGTKPLLQTFEDQVATCQESQAKRALLGNCCFSLNPKSLLDQVILIGMERIDDFGGDIVNSSLKPEIVR